MKTCSILLFTALAALSAFGQAAASMSPTEVTAGKNITITITVNKTPSVAGTQLLAYLTPKDPKDNPPAFNLTLNPKSDDPKVYTNSGMIPENAKGIWSLENATLIIPSGGNTRVETNHPELRVKPIGVTLPTTGKAEITVP